MTIERVQKVIARAGLYSRRGAEDLIRQNRVRLNNKTVQLGDKAGPDDEIYIDDQLIERAQDSLRVLLLNKPQGTISSRRDPGKRKSVFDLLPHIKRGRWISVGRLDFNTSGLLLFTTDGELANQLMHPSSNIEREYLCRVFGEVNDNKINILRKGFKLKPENVVARFKTIKEVPSSSANKWFKVVLNQGRYREVRRLWQHVGCEVNRLSRIRFAHLQLPKELSAGKYIELSMDEIDLLKNIND